MIEEHCSLADERVTVDVSFFMSIQALLSNRPDPFSQPKTTTKERTPHCDCGASVRSSSSSSSAAPLVGGGGGVDRGCDGGGGNDDPRATYRSRDRRQKRLRPNFVPPTIKESMAETFTKSVPPSHYGTKPGLFET